MCEGEDGNCNGSVGKANRRYFNSAAIAKKIQPSWEANRLRSYAANLDEAALYFDIGTEAGVAMSTIGAFLLGGLIGFEGAPVTGLAAAAAGWVTGQVLVQPALQIGNALATLSTAATVLADLKTGETGILGYVDTGGSGMEGSTTINISSNTQVSTGLTGIGWAASVSEISLGIQYLAVLNDRNSLPNPIQTLYPSYQANLTFQFP